MVVRALDTVSASARHRCPALLPTCKIAGQGIRAPAAAERAPWIGISRLCVARLRFAEQRHSNDKKRNDRHACHGFSPCRRSCLPRILAVLLRRRNKRPRVTQRRWSLPQYAALPSLRAACSSAQVLIAIPRRDHSKSFILVSTMSNSVAGCFPLRRRYFIKRVLENQFWVFAISETTMPIEFPHSAITRLRDGCWTSCADCEQADCGKPYEHWLRAMHYKLGAMAGYGPPGRGRWAGLLALEAHRRALW